MIDSVKPTAQIPAVQGQFGRRLATYTSQLPPGAIETVLGHDPRSKYWTKLPDDLAGIYKYLQRTTTRKRLDSIVRYIRYRFTERATICGAFPAISIAVQNPTEFTPFEVPHKGVGVLHFDLSRRNRRVMVDGLGRATASLELLEWSEDLELPEEVRAALRELIGEFSLPTVFYVPAPGQPALKLEEMQQLFHDFNFKVTPVSARHAMALDHSDLYIGLANELGDSDVIKRMGGMEMKAASLGRKSTAIVVQQNLVRFVRAATEGERFIEAKTNSQLESPNLDPDTIDQFADGLTAYLEGIVSAMGEERFKDREALHLTAPGWGALGVIYHDLVVRLRETDLKNAAGKIGKLDWHRSSSEWSEITRPGKDVEGNDVIGLAGGGAQNRRFITRKLREALGITQRLEALEAPEPDQSRSAAQAA